MHNRRIQILGPLVDILNPSIYTGEVSLDYEFSPGSNELNFGFLQIYIKRYLWKWDKLPKSV